MWPAPPSCRVTVESPELTYPTWTHHGHSGAGASKGMRTARPEVIRWPQSSAGPATTSKPSTVAGRMRPKSSNTEGASASVTKTGLRGTARKKCDYKLSG